MQLHWAAEACRIKLQSSRRSSAKVSHAMTLCSVMMMQACQQECSSAGIDHDAKGICCTRGARGKMHRLKAMTWASQHLCQTR